jgi:hypothetical protein
LLDNAVRANIKLVVGQLKSFLPVAEWAKHDLISIVGAQYNLGCGTVEMIS